MTHSAIVKYLDSFGAESTDHVAAAPCVEALYSFQKLSVSEVAVFEGRAWALIDTGADLTHIDAALVPQHAKKIREISLSGATGEVQTWSYEVQMQLVGTETALSVEVVPLAGDRTRPYRLILGRMFLARCRFLNDGPLGIRSITYLSQAERDALASGNLAATTL